MRKMNSVLMAIALFVSVSLASCGLFRGPLTVTLEITQTHDYCGGAPPPEDLLQDLATPKPIQEQQLWVSPKKKRSLTLINVNEGTAQVKLKPGQYVIYWASEETIDEFLQKYRVPEDMVSCYRDWMRTEVAEFEVTADMSKVTFNIHRQCDPCAPPPP